MAGTLLHSDIRTLLDAVTRSLQRTLRTGDGTAVPSAVLWTDPDRQWRPLVTLLQRDLPQLYALGTYSPTDRTGPAIWLKCIVDRTLEDAPGSGIVPILYLGGVGRQELRAGHDCRPACQPLIELLFRGKAWHQENGRDWTVEAFLVSEEGLGLDAAKDPLTKEAILRALPVLATTPLEGLRGRRLDSHDFDHLTIPDPVRDVLRWLAGADALRTQLDAGRWDTFCQVCRSQFGFDPNEVEPRDVARQFVEGHGRWEELWQRFCEAPRSYRDIASLLRKSELVAGRLPFDEARLPAVNERAEADLQAALEAAAGLPQHEARPRVLELEREHGIRRGWVWADLGESPLASALLPLSRLAVLTAAPGSGAAALDPAVASHAADGWRCDRAALDALALHLSPSLAMVVANVVRALYGPWLDESARSFQSLAAGHAGNLGRPTQAGPPGGDACVLFVDGLRFDLGAALQERLELRELKVRTSARIAPIPTVTASAKPLASLVADAVSGLTANDDFTPVLRASGQPATVTRLRMEMGRRDIQVIEGDDLEPPRSSTAVGWSECGRLDELGHKLGAGLAHQIDQELDVIADRIVGLLQCGWSRVRVVTDHGWLLLPGGLPRVELPSSTTATKWARCACVRGDSQPDMPVFPWHWHDDVRIASPPGIGSFFAGAEYAHGGLSFQECVVPELTVERVARAVRVSISDATWRRMRVRIRVTPATTGLKVDLRRNWKLASTSLVAAPKELDSAGEASLVVAGDKDEGASATIVVLDANGNVVERRPTTVGENS